MNHSEVQAWIDAYLRAWKTNDRAEIGVLFSEDATYAYHPYDSGDDIVHGREAITATWLENQDAPGSWDASFAPRVVEGNEAVIEGTTTYHDGPKYWNIWTVTFDEDRRCRSFVEWFMTKPEH